MQLRIKAKPGSKVNQVMIAGDGSVIVKIKAPAQDGKANEELALFLAETLGLAKSNVRILSGFTSAYKKLEIDAEEFAVMKKLKGQ